MPKRLQSPSSINTFRQCPRKYYYQYVLKLPTKPSIHLVRGSVAHSALEDFFNTITHLNIDQIIEKGFTTHALELLAHHWKENEKEFQKLDLTKEQIEFYLIETHQMIKNWVHHFSFQHDMLVEQGLNDIDAFHKLKPKTEVYYKNEDLYVHGYVDAIHENGNRVKIIDYKTSKTAKISEEYILQLGIYALMYEIQHKKRPQEVGIFFLKDTEHTVDVTDEIVNNARLAIEEIHLLTQDAENKEDYPKKPSPLCKWSSGQCDFYDKCFPNGKNSYM